MVVEDPRRSSDGCLMNERQIYRHFVDDSYLVASLNKLGDGGVLPVWTQSGQHCAYGFLPYRRTQAFPLDLTQIRVYLVRWMEVFRFIIQHAISRWTDYKVLPGVTTVNLLGSRLSN